jgi:hypothetical protein
MEPVSHGSAWERSASRERFIELRENLIRAVSAPGPGLPADLQSPPMFEATYLGWQSWLFGTASTHVLVDPLLATDEAGRGPSQARMNFLFPFRREFTFERLPAVQAVVLTHEHEDHFDIPTLARIERTVPIYLSSRASIAARMMLSELGFQVHLMAAGEQLTVGDLRFEFDGPSVEHLGEGNDEWDTLAFLVEQTGGAGALLTNVDIMMPERLAQLADQRVQAGQGVLYFGSMATRMWNVGGTAVKQKDMHRGNPQQSFILDPAQARATLEQGGSVRPVPGQSFHMEGGRVRDVQPEMPFLRTPRTDRFREDFSPYYPRGEGMDFAPLFGTEPLAKAEHDELKVRLNQLAIFLQGGPVYRGLYTRSLQQLKGRKPTFVWLLLEGDGEVFAYEYRPEACAFAPVEVEAGINERYAGFAACWARDLLMLLRGVYEPRVLNRAFREQFWPSCFEGSPPVLMTAGLMPYLHPLRQPGQVLKRYRERLAELEQAPLAVRHGHARAA